MRRCAKFHCELEARATVAVRYADRIVLIGDLLERPDPNLLDLCREHADRLSPPVGWTCRDQRAEGASAPLVSAEGLISG